MMHHSVPRSGYFERGSKIELYYLRTKMDFNTIPQRLLEVKKETILYIAKKAAIPLTIIPLIWMIILRKSGFAGKGGVDVKKPAEELLAHEDDGGGSHYNLRNLVCYFKLNLVCFYACMCIRVYIYHFISHPKFCQSF